MSVRSAKRDSWKIFDQNDLQEEINESINIQLLCYNLHYHIPNLHHHIPPPITSLTSTITSLHPSHRIPPPSHHTFTLVTPIFGYCINNHRPRELFVNQRFWQLKFSHISFLMSLIIMVSCHYGTHHITKKHVVATYNGYV